MDGALRAIRCAREREVPFFGSCGGFQHALIEYTRDVLGLAEAGHAESNPSAALPLIAPLTCSLVGQRGTVTLVAASGTAPICSAPQMGPRFPSNVCLYTPVPSLIQDRAPP